ncbi:hypothetical protein M0802_009009 [Mischocyttarus mexicanus]|nr:hypothetical protein M0802_009009 [Mischocyttarus mexicanus]
MESIEYGIRSKEEKNRRCKKANKPVDSTNEMGFGGLKGIGDSRKSGGGGGDGGGRMVMMLLLLLLVLLVTMVGMDFHVCPRANKLAPTW